MSLYPSYRWEMNRFSKNVREFWKDDALVARILHQLNEELFIDDLEDWYRVSLDTLDRFGARHMVQMRAGLYSVEYLVF